MIRHASPRNAVIRRSERKRRMKHRPGHMSMQRPTATQPTNSKITPHYHPEGDCAHSRRASRQYGRTYTRELWKGILQRRAADKPKRTTGATKWRRKRRKKK